MDFRGKIIFTPFVGKIQLWEFTDIHSSSIKPRLFIVFSLLTEETNIAFDEERKLRSNIASVFRFVKLFSFVFVRKKLVIKQISSAINTSDWTLKQEKSRIMKSG
jgi:hypothetical protein